ncbi:GNAT family N-acetyltransferase [Segeticoccus rhizosphaerae]|uniref:GNAT family N-acetyltransferase n=1 Tax=Segeticoccus rhizosphaerae TaxID=1104777 RepID=UPI001264F326|nr:GNAT family N-acetyltransferase [Segeticoccus rhizosphaerae]HEX5427506.1 GNAT family N-acetyltransferase [Pedococcus sp.]
MKPVRLEQLGPAHRAGYQAMVREWQELAGAYPFNDGELALRDFDAFLGDVALEGDSPSGPDGVFRQISYMIVASDGEVLGELRFRPWLEAPYRSHHGHVACNVRPSRRGQGVARAAFAAVLDIAARDFGLPVVTADVEGENPASVRVLLHAGSRLVLEETRPDSSRVRWFECPTVVLPPTRAM